MIAVYYSTKKSSAQGLEKKLSDENGYVTWVWKVGGSTKAKKDCGIRIGESSTNEYQFKTTFEVIEN